MKKFILQTAFVFVLAACSNTPEKADDHPGSASLPDSLSPTKDSVVVPVHEQHKDSSVMTKD